MMRLLSMLLRYFRCSSFQGTDMVIDLDCPWFGLILHLPLDALSD